VWRPENLAPYIIATLGVSADYMTTQLGLAKGLREAHVLYNPICALTIFWAALTVATLALPKRAIWRLTVSVLAYVSFTGAFNNILVILGIFRGLVP